MQSEPKMVPNTKNEIGTRLKYVVSNLGGVQSVIEKTSLKASTLHRYMSGETDIRLADAAMLCNMAGMSLDWLVSGDMQQPKAIGADKAAQIWDDYALVSGYSIQVSAGTGAIPNSEEVTRRLAFRRGWLKYRGLCEENLLVVFARGDSMLPTINDNDTIMIDTSETSPQDGRMYVIRVEEHLLVKRTQIVPGQGVMLISDNKDYPPMLVKFTDPESDVKVVGRVVWIGKDV